MVPLSLFFFGLAFADDTGARQRLLADQDWKFNLGDVSGAEAPAFDDSSWRTLDLPHDWSIEEKFDKKDPTGVREAYLPEGIGWYRHTFNAPVEWQGKKVTIEFEGIYMNATIWLNGTQLGFHPYGYTSFFCDLTPLLKVGVPNVLAVRIDNSKQLNSRWYSGSGIYRHVWLTVTNPVHIAPWGVFVATKDTVFDAAHLQVTTTLANDSDSAESLTLQTCVLGPDGTPVAQKESPAQVSEHKTAKVTQIIAVSQPSLWSPDFPKLYQALTRLSKNGQVIDEITTSFGIRTLAWSVDHGLQINGEIEIVTKTAPASVSRGTQVSFANNRLLCQVSIPGRFEAVFA